MYKEFQENWQLFSKLIEEVPHLENEQLNIIIKRYVEQNILMLNDMLTTSIENLKQLKNVKSVNDVICSQAKLSNELSKKLSLSTQRFLNASLENIADYNEWLKAHCDLATD